VNIVRYRFVILSSALVLVCASNIAAQEQEPLEAEWLAKDLQSVELISSLASPSALTVERIKDVLSLGKDGELEDLGFDMISFDLAIGNGYTRLYVEGLAVKGSIASYKLGIEASSESWPHIRERIIEVWKENGGPEFTETDSGIMHVETNEAVLQVYKASVVAALGEMKRVDVPNELKNSFDYLMSPLECRAFGTRGHVAIAALVNAGRLDLVENVLRGFSPSGRVHAAVALLKLNRTEQLVLSPETLSTIEKIRSLDTSITQVDGCLVSRRTAKKILSEEQ
jgi:hypothetical protein